MSSPDGPGLDNPVSLQREGRGQVAWRSQGFQEYTSTASLLGFSPSTQFSFQEPPRLCLVGSRSRKQGVLASSSRVPQPERTLSPPGLCSKLTTLGGSYSSNLWAISQQFTALSAEKSDHSQSAHMCMLAINI